MTAISDSAQLRLGAAAAFPIAGDRVRGDGAATQRRQGAHGLAVRVPQVSWATAARRDQAAIDQQSRGSLVVLSVAN